MSNEVRICPVCLSTFIRDQNTGGCMTCEKLKTTKIGIDLSSNDPQIRAAAQKLQVQRVQERDKFFNIPFRDANTKKVITCGSCGRPMVGLTTPVCMNTICARYGIDWDRQQAFVKLQ